jgi:hypothetical protein
MIFIINNDSLQNLHIHTPLAGYRVLLLRGRCGMQTDLITRTHIRTYSVQNFYAGVSVPTTLPAPMRPRTAVVKCSP